MDENEVGARRQEWNIESRIYCEELSSNAMLQSLIQASNLLSGAVRTAWRYVPHDDTILAVCHAHTPILRRREGDTKAFLFPKGLYRAQLPATVHKTDPKPQITYDVHPAYLRSFCKSKLLFPADQGRLGLVELGFGDRRQRCLYLEKDEALITFIGPAPEPLVIESKAKKSKQADIQLSSKSEVKENVRKGRKGAKHHHEEKAPIMEEKPQTPKEPEDPKCSPPPSPRTLVARFRDGSSVTLHQSEDELECPATMIITTANGVRVELCGRTNNVYQSRVSKSVHHRTT
eukprot:1136939-Amorphochlora_amoeboformis.AAC.2